MMQDRCGSCKKEDMGKGVGATTDEPRNIRLSANKIFKVETIFRDALL